MTSVSSENKKSLVSSHPFFSQLKTEEIDELVKLSFEKLFPQNQVIISQGKIVDAIYLIAQGKVEVAHEIQEGDQIKLIPVILLKEGDAIGLSRLGFFSRTGLRTATLTTLTETVLIGWDLETFYYFLQKHPEFNSSTQQLGEKLLRMNFIKRVEPFEALPEEKILWLADQIQERIVEGGTTLFNEGDQGEECYLVRYGQVEITNSTGKRLALLEPPMICGEMAILTDSPRNANARTLMKCVLLVLKRKQLDALIEHHDIHASMMTLVVQRSRPIRLARTLHYERQLDDDQKMTILKDPVNRKYFKLSQEGWYIWELLDGTRTIEELTVDMYKLHKIFAPDAIADTLFNLADAGFVLMPEIHHVSTIETKEELPLRVRIQDLIWKWSHIQITFNNIDHKFNNSYSKVVQYLFTPIGFIITLGISLLGIVMWSLFFAQGMTILQSNFTVAPLLFSLLLVYLFSVVIHEAAHGYATKSHGREVHHGGVILSWVGLIAYVDTSDMWLEDRTSRICVSIAGPFADLFMGGIAGILAWIIPLPQLAIFFWLLAFLLYYGVFKNLNPLFDGDGYGICKEALNQQYLDVDAYKWLSRPKFSNELIYWLICFIFLVAGVFIAYEFQYYLRMVLPETILGIATVHLSWLLPSVVIVKFLLRVNALRKAAKNSLS